MMRFFTSVFSQSNASCSSASYLTTVQRLTKSTEYAARVSSSSVVFIRPTKPSTFSASLACRSLAILASMSISSHPGSMRANGSSSSSSSPSHELPDILDSSMRPPSSDPCTLSSFSTSDSVGPNTSEKSSSSSSANFCISIDDGARRMGLSGSTEGRGCAFLRKLPSSPTFMDRGRLVRSEGWKSCGESLCLET